MTTMLPQPVYSLPAMVRAHDAGQGGEPDTFLAVISEVDEGHILDGRTGLPTFGGCRLWPLTRPNADALAVFIGRTRHDVLPLSRRQMANSLASLIERRAGEHKFAKMALDSLAQAEPELVADPALAPVLETARETVERHEAERAARQPVELRGYR
jgi:hypothetical protein